MSQKDEISGKAGIVKDSQAGAAGAETKKFLVIEKSGSMIKNLGVVSAENKEDAVKKYARDGAEESALKAYSAGSLRSGWKFLDIRLMKLTAEAKKCWLKNRGNCAAVWTGYNGYKNNTSHACHHCQKFAGQKTASV